MTRKEMNFLSRPRERMAIGILGLVHLLVSFKIVYYMHKINTYDSGRYPTYPIHLPNYIIIQ